MIEVVIKRGQSLPWSLAFIEEACQQPGTPVDLTNSVVTSQVRDARDELVLAFPVVVPQPTTGVCGIFVADTSLWPLGTLRCDVRVVTAGVTVFSETFAVRVERAVTR